MTSFNSLTDLRTQFVIFFRKTNNLDFEQLSVSIKSALNLNFVSPAKYTNLPEGIPAEIPRLELQTHDHIFHIGVSLSTISLTYNRPATERDTTYMDLIAKIRSLAELITRVGTIVRVGYVTNQFIPHDNPSDFILENIIRRKPAGAFEASYRVVLKSNYDQKHFNESFSFEQGEKVDQGKPAQPIVLITRDINTPPDNNIKMTPDMVCEFIQKTYKTLENARIEEVFGGA